VAIAVLENNPNTNAGFGSNLTWDKTIECEASIMDSKTLNFGACTNVSTVKNPIKLARNLCDKQSKLLSMSRIPPMVLSGQGAASYAANVGLALVDPDTMVSKKALNYYNHYKKDIDDYAVANNVQISPLDTVGAVCVDHAGNMASGCSSGGLLLKIPGRVGQAATYGAGCYAQTSEKTACCTCTTGNGEYLMKTLLAREIVQELMTCNCAVTSMHQVFNEKLLKSPFLASLDEIYGGALTLYFDKETRDGEVIWSHTTKSMCLAYQSTERKKPKFILSTMPSNEKPGKKTSVTAQHFKVLM
jgi:taspase, threonine aspartase, 1